MISFLRKILDSWVVYAILGLVTLTFVITGIRDPFAGGGSDVTVARVGSARLGASQLVNEITARIRGVQRQQPQLTLTDAVRQGADRQILDLLIKRMSVVELMRRQGMAAGTHTVADYVAAQTAFQVAGKYDDKTFEAVLRQNNVNKRDYFRDLEADLSSRQVLASVSRGWKVPDSVLLNFATMLEQQRMVSVVEVRASQLPPPPAPTDTDLKTYYTQHISRYQAPERRGFRYFLLNLESVSPLVSVSDTEVARYYQDHIADFGGIEQRTLNQVTVDSEATAQKLINDVKAGQDFIAAAKAAVPGLTDSDIERGTTTEKDLARDLGGAVAKAVFALPTKGVSQPIKVELGWQILSVKNITAAKGAAFDDAAKAKISSQLKRDKATDKLADLSKQVDDGANARKSFEVLAKLASATIKTVEPLTREGGTAAGVRHPDATALQPVLKSAFDRRPGDQLSLDVIDDSHYVMVDVQTISPAAARPLADVKAIVSAEWTRDASTKKAEAAGKALMAAAAHAKLADLAAKNNYKLTNVKWRWLDVRQAGQQLPIAVSRAFELNKGERALAPAPSGDGVVVVQLDDVITKKAEKTEPLFNTLRSQFDRLSVTEAQVQIFQAARDELRVQKNEAAIKAVHQQLVGGGN